MRHAASTQARLEFGRVGHALSQVPQWSTLVRVFTSQPLADTPSQLPKPGLHAPMTQVFAAHVAAALANSQRLPQRPQCWVLAASTVSQPLARSPSQSAKPAAQAPGAHSPATQAA
jgi:hypothetical protein